QDGADRREHYRQHLHRIRLSPDTRVADVHLGAVFALRRRELVRRQFDRAEWCNDLRQGDAPSPGYGDEELAASFSSENSSGRRGRSIYFWGLERESLRPAPRSLQPLRQVLAHWRIVEGIEKRRGVETRRSLHLRNHHAHRVDVIAGLAGARILCSFSAKPKPLASLRARRDLGLYDSVDRRHLDLRAGVGLFHGDWNDSGDVVAVTLEVRVRRDAHGHV